MLINEYQDKKSESFCQKCYERESQIALTASEKEIEEIQARMLKTVHSIPVVSSHSPADWDYETIGFVTGQSAMGTGFFSEISSSVSDLFGSQSEALGDKIRSGEKNCILQIKKQAMDKGGNAILALDIDYNEMGAVYLNGGMRLGPDGKIYCSNWEGVYTILSPDSIGKSCNFSTNYITLPAGVQSHPRQLGENTVKPSVYYSQHATDTVVCDDYPTVLRATATGIRQVWNDGDTMPVKTIGKSAKYWVQSFRDCNVHTDTFNVTVSNCRCIISVPNAFTPNNNGRNDRFRVLGTDIVELSMKIYNRFGQCVFQSFDAKQTWDGRFQGQECEIGDYFYFLHARCIQGQEIFRKGELLLIR